MVQGARDPAIPPEFRRNIPSGLPRNPSYLKRLKWSNDAAESCWELGWFALSSLDWSADQLPPNSGPRIWSRVQVGANRARSASFVRATLQAGISHDPPSGEARHLSTPISLICRGFGAPSAAQFTSPRQALTNNRAGPQVGSPGKAHRSWWALGCAPKRIPGMTYPNCATTWVSHCLSIAQIGSMGKDKRPAPCLTCYALGE